MADKVEIKIDKDMATVKGNVNSGIAKILAAAGKVKILGREVKIKK